MTTREFDGKQSSSATSVLRVRNLLLGLVGVIALACGDSAGDSPTANGPVLAIGWRSEGEFGAQIPHVLRFADQRWQSAALPESMLQQYLFTRDGASLPEGGTFRLWRAHWSSPDDAWILVRGPGIRGEGGALLHSSDGGQNFADVSHLLPAELRFSARNLADTPFALHMEAAKRWWIAAGFKIGADVTGPAVWRTDDGGESWRQVGGFAEDTSSSMFFTGFGGGLALLFEGEGVCSRLYAFGESPLPSEQVAPCIAHQQDYAETARRGFLVTPHAASIWVSREDGTSWSEQPLPTAADVFTSPTVIDFADDEHGVACGTVRRDFLGNNPHARRTVTCWRSIDAGETWQASTVPEDPSLLETSDVLLSSAQTGWLIAGGGHDSDSGPIPRFRFLRSDDGAATWQPTITDFDEGFRMAAFAHH